MRFCKDYDGFRENLQERNRESTSSGIMFLFGGRELTEEEKLQQEEERLEEERKYRERRDLVQIINNMLQDTKEKLAEEEYISSTLKNEIEHIKYALTEKDQQIEKMANQILELDKKNQELIWSNQELTKVKSRNEYEVEIEDKKERVRALEQLNIALHRSRVLMKYFGDQENKRNTIANRFFTWKFHTRYSALLSKKKEESSKLQKQLEDVQNQLKIKQENIQVKNETHFEENTSIRKKEINISSYSYLFKEFDVELDRLKRQIISTNDIILNKGMDALDIKIENTSASGYHDEHHHSESIYLHLPSIQETLYDESKINTKETDRKGSPSNHRYFEPVSEPTTNLKSTVSNSPKFNNQNDDQNNFTDIEKVESIKSDEAKEINLTSTNKLTADETLPEKNEKISMHQQDNAPPRDDEVNMSANRVYNQVDNSIGMPDDLFDDNENNSNEAFVDEFQQTFDPKPTLKIEANDNQVHFDDRETYSDNSQLEKKIFVERKVNPDFFIDLNERISPRPVVTSFSTIKTSPQSPRSPLRRHLTSTQALFPQEKMETDTKNDIYSQGNHAQQPINRNMEVENHEQESSDPEEENGNMLETIDFSDDESTGAVDTFPSYTNDESYNNQNNEMMKQVGVGLINHPEENSRSPKNLFSSVLNTTQSILFPLSHGAMLKREEDYFRTTEGQDMTYTDTKITPNYQSEQNDNAVDTLFPDDENEAFMSGSTGSRTNNVNYPSSATKGIPPFHNNSSSDYSESSMVQPIALNSTKKLALSSENSFDEIPLSPSTSPPKFVDMERIEASSSSSISKIKTVFGTTLRSPINDIDEDEGLYDDINSMKSGGASFTSMTSNQHKNENNFMRDRNFEPQNYTQRLNTQQQKLHFFEEEECEIDILFPDSSSNDFTVPFGGQGTQNKYSGTKNSVFFDA